MERKSGHQITLEMIRTAFEKGWDVDNPDKQFAPVIRIGVKRLREGKQLTADDIEKIEKMGGTDHPDPWINLNKLI